ncbi:HNH endonuclease [Kangiella marina]|uniref:HNH domain-containing protein n=1 Tax=Kangiella marina TaxID=1079178 RepID=A0ABP8IMK9_9GAMM
MNKNQAIALINKSHEHISLTGKNTHWANLSAYGGKNGWWLNVPFGKFEEDLYFVLNNEQSGQMLFVHIPSGAISEPKTKFRNKENTADIFISAANTNKLSLSAPLVDNQSNSTEHNFSSYHIKIIEHSNRIESPDNLYPEEVPSALKEGSKKIITVNSYERNSKARSECINRYGVSCTVCGFNFENTYGRRGKGFIHVHHLIPVSDIGDEYEVNPITDLRPVCPNCHAMLHRKGSISIEELINEIKSNK